LIKKLELLLLTVTSVYTRAWYLREGNVYVLIVVKC